MLCCPPLAMQGWPNVVFLVGFVTNHPHGYKICHLKQCIVGRPSLSVVYDFQTFKTLIIKLHQETTIFISHYSYQHLIFLPTKEILIFHQSHKLGSKIQFSVAEQPYGSYTQNLRRKQFNRFEVINKVVSSTFMVVLN